VDTGHLCIRPFVDQTTGRPGGVGRSTTKTDRSVAPPAHPPLTLSTDAAQTAADGSATTPVGDNVISHDIISHLFTGRMPQSGKLPVLNLFTCQKSGFSPRRGNSLHRFRSNLAASTGTRVFLAVQNFASVAKGGWECGPQNIKNFHFLVKSRPQGRLP